MMHIIKELYIFDMGGVVSHNCDVFQSIADNLSITRDDFSVFAEENIRELMEGRIQSNEFWSRFSYIYGRTVEERLFSRFFNPIPDEGTINIIERLKKGSTVVCGTNTIDDHYDKHFSLGDYDCFDAVYASNKIGISKPNPDFYRYILKQEKIDPQNVCFIDNEQENVIAAESLGIKSVLFTNSESLDRTLGAI